MENDPPAKKVFKSIKIKQRGKGQNPGKWIREKPMAG